MTTKLIWNTHPPETKVDAIVIVKDVAEPNFIAIAEYDPQQEAWFERGGLNLDFGGFTIIRWAEIPQLNKLLKE